MPIGVGPQLDMRLIRVNPWQKLSQIQLNLLKERYDTYYESTAREVIAHIVPKEVSETDAGDLTKAFDTTKLDDLVKAGADYHCLERCSDADMIACEQLLRYHRLNALKGQPTETQLYQNTMRFASDNISRTLKVELAAIAEKYWIGKSFKDINNFVPARELVHRLRFQNEFPQQCITRPLPVGVPRITTGGSIHNADKYLIIERYSTHTKRIPKVLQQAWPFRRVERIFGLSTPKVKMVGHRSRANASPHHRTFDKAFADIPDDGTVVLMLKGHDALGVNFDGWVQYSWHWSSINIWVIVRDSRKRVRGHLSDAEWNKVKHAWSDQCGDNTYMTCYNMADLLRTHTRLARQEDAARDHMLELWDRTYNIRMRAVESNDGFAAGRMRNEIVVDDASDDEADDCGDVEEADDLLMEKRTMQL
ncbi:MAG: hypothetical protein Q9198_005652 [Flavoplaca austrocitrina]